MCITALYDLTGLRTATLQEEQGFLTSTGRFVDRIEAGKIAVAAGQLTKVPRLSGRLHSEDLL